MGALAVDLDPFGYLQIAGLRLVEVIQAPTAGCGDAFEFGEICQVVCSDQLVGAVEDFEGVWAFPRFVEGIFARFESLEGAPFIDAGVSGGKGGRTKTACTVILGIGFLDRFHAAHGVYSRPAPLNLGEGDLDGLQLVVDFPGDNDHNDPAVGFAAGGADILALMAAQVDVRHKTALADLQFPPEIAVAIDIQPTLAEVRCLCFIKIGSDIPFGNDGNGEVGKFFRTPGLGGIFFDCFGLSQRDNDIFLVFLFAWLEFFVI